MWIIHSHHHGGGSSKRNMTTEFEPTYSDKELSRHVMPSAKDDPYVITKVIIEREERRMNKDFPQDAKCDCGHSYYRHFDGYENWAAVGCKYCTCGEWHKPVEKAGIIPYHMSGNEIYMLFMVSSDPKYGGPLPQISKGYIDPEDKGSQEGAFREGQEELGLKEENCIYGSRFSTYNVYKGIIPGDEKEYTFALYAVEVQDRNNFDKPHFETKETIWMTPAQFQYYGREAHRELVKKAFVEIGKHHGYLETTNKEDSQ